MSLLCVFSDFWVFGRFPGVSCRVSYPPGPILESVFLWRCFCRQKPPCNPRAVSSDLILLVLEALWFEHVCARIPTPWRRDRRECIASLCYCSVPWKNGLPTRIQLVSTMRTVEFDVWGWPVLGNRFRRAREPGSGRFSGVAFSKSGRPQRPGKVFEKWGRSPPHV